jgi:hypothetical protein
MASSSSVASSSSSGLYQIDGDIHFTNAHSDSVYYFGEIPAYTRTVTAENCGLVQYRMLCGTSTNFPVTSINNDVITTCGGIIRVEAYAVCNGEERILKVKRGRGVEKPSLTGVCEWSSEDDFYAGGSTARVKTPPVLTGGFKCEGPSFFKNNVAINAVSAGLRVDPFVSEGQSMEGIYVSAICEDEELTTLTCPKINVVSVNAASCEYQLSMCGGIPLSQVQGLNSINVTSGAINSSSNAYGLPYSRDGCVFVTNITNIEGANNGTINDSLPSNLGAPQWQCGDGSVLPYLTFPCSGRLPQKVDGGYYIPYKANGGVYYNVLTATNEYGNQLHPNCEAAK